MRFGGNVDRRICYVAAKESASITDEYVVVRQCPCVIGLNRVYDRSSIVAAGFAIDTGIRNEELEVDIFGEALYEVEAL